MYKLFMIVAKDSRVFWDMDESKEALLKKIKIPVKSIYEGGVLVWEDKTN